MKEKNTFLNLILIFPTNLYNHKNLLQHLFYFKSLINFKFYWSITGLQCCVSFRCTAKGFSYTYTYIIFFFKYFSHLGYCRIQFSSIAQSCLAFCDSMNCSMPGLPVHHQLPESTQTHVPSSRSCHPTISSSVVPFSSCPQSFPASGSFQISQPFASGGQGIGDSASTSVLPMNTQD